MGAPVTPPWPSDRRVARFARRAQKQAERQRRQWDSQRMRQLHSSQRSIVGPLLLIGIGVACLLIETHRVTWILALDGLSTWWPAILIGAGCVVVLEWALHQGRSRRLGTPASHSFPRLGFGAVCLLLLLTGVGIGARELLERPPIAEWDHWGDRNFAQMFGTDHEQRLAPTVIPAGGAGTLSLVNPRGDLNVSGTSQDGNIHLLATLHVFGFDRLGAQKTLTSLAPIIDNRDGTLSITFPSRPDSETDVQLVVPGSMAVALTGNHGWVVASNLTKPLTLIAVQGKIDLRQIAGARIRVDSEDSNVSIMGSSGPVTINGRAGDVDAVDLDDGLEMNGSFYGATHLERIRNGIRFVTHRTTLKAQAVPGSLEITSGSTLSGKGIEGPFALQTRDRHISLSELSGLVAIENTHGPVEVAITGTPQPIRVQDHDGAVTVSPLLCSSIQRARAHPRRAHPY